MIDIKTNEELVEMTSRLRDSHSEYLSNLFDVFKWLSNKDNFTNTKEIEKEINDLYVTIYSIVVFHEKNVEGHLSDFKKAFELNSPEASEAVKKSL